MGKLVITPFNEFWLDCGFNNTFSILTSFDESYRELAYLNCYTYVPYNEWAPKHIELRNGSDVQYEVINEIIYKKPFSFQYSKANIRKVINQIKTNNILLKVDLYNWLPNSSSWHKLHNFHHSLIVDFDEINDCIIVLDDDNKGYSKHAIPMRRFVECVKDQNGYISGYSVKCIKAPEYKLDINLVLKFATILIRDLEYFLINDLWTTKQTKEGDILYEFYGFEVFKIVNRQIANLLLIKKLHEYGYIYESLYQDLFNGFTEIKNGWICIKNSLIKLYYSPNGNEIQKIKVLNVLKNKLISEEIDVWKKICHETVV